MAADISRILMMKRDQLHTIPQALSREGLRCDPIDQPRHPGSPEHFGWWRFEDESSLADGMVKALAGQPYPQLVEWASLIVGVYDRGEWAEADGQVLLDRVCRCLLSNGAVHPFDLTPIPERQPPR